MASLLCLQVTKFNFHFQLLKRGFKYLKYLNMNVGYIQGWNTNQAKQATAPGPQTHLVAISLWLYYYLRMYLLILCASLKHIIN